MQAVAAWCYSNSMERMDRPSADLRCVECGLCVEPCGEEAADCSNPETPVGRHNQELVQKYLQALASMEVDIEPVYKKVV
jgi:ferredoxin